MPVLESWKKQIKAVPMLHGPLRACRQTLRGLTEMGPTEIEAHHGWPRLQLGELWRFRELLFTMAYRDFRIRYRQTILGVLWAIVPTIMAGIVFTIFCRLANLDAEGLPRAAFYFAAAIPWNFFSYILVQSAGSLTLNLHLVLKVYFPRLILPLKSVVVGGIDLLLASTLILATMAYYGRWPSTNIVWLPVFLSLALLAGLGIGLWFAALNVYFRDVVNFLPYCMQIWFFMTPIIYSPTMVPEPWRTVLRFNPMASVATGCRWCLFDAGDPPDLILALVFLVTLAVSIGGLYFFRRVERTLADVV